MNRPPVPAVSGAFRAACAVAVLTLPLAACGQEQGGAGEPGTRGGTPSVSQEEYERSMLAQHDGTWPEMAAACADVRPEETPEGGAGGEQGAGGAENPRHAENNSFRQTASVPPEQRCRGEAHAARIAAAMAGEDGAFGTAEQTRDLLERLGYDAAGLSVREAGTGVAAWELAISGAGPCISGHTGTPDRIEVHGMYLEGGCREPQGGH